MADDVLVGEADGGNALDALQEADAREQAAVFPAGQVYLGGISGDDEFGAGAHAGEEHLQLPQVGVLGLVQNDAGFVQGASAHVGEGGNLDGAVPHEFLQLFGGNHVREGIVEGLQIRVQFVFEVSGEEAQALAGFYRGAGEDDAFDFPVFERPYGKGDGHVGFTGSGGANREDEVVVKIGLHQLLLGFSAGADGLAVRAIHNDGVAVQAEAVRAVAGEDILYVVHGEIHLVMAPFHQLGKADVELCNVAFLAFQDEFVAAGNYFKMGEIRAEFAQDSIASTINFYGVDGFQLDRFFHA